ncbi:hypothetical protein [Bartonella sp. WD12.1]|uniref:hypothetical protein n=1 Tax=Bartonella sp. WD12.1 TaxID=1933903 RepID=UPI001300EFC0|nr:hypothetical protein [Bartonella sp. WD12.1]
MWGWRGELECVGGSRLVVSVWGNGRERRCWGLLFEKVDLEGEWYTSGGEKLRAGDGWGMLVGRKSCEGMDLWMGSGRSVECAMWCGAKEWGLCGLV